MFATSLSSAPSYNPAVQLSYQLTAEDYRHAFDAFRNRNKRVRLRKRILTVICLLGLLMAMATTILIPEKPASPVVLGLICLYWVYCQWYAPYVIARKMMASPDARSARTVDANDRGLYDHTDVSDARLDWSMFVGWSENDRVFTLLPSEVSFLPVPKRAMTPVQQDEFRALLRQHIPG